MADICIVVKVKPNELAVFYKEAQRKTSSQMVKKWFKNGSKIVQKWLKNGTGISDMLSMCSSITYRVSRIPAKDIPAKDIFSNMVPMSISLTGRFSRKSRIPF